MKVVEVVGVVELRRSGGVNKLTGVQVGADQLGLFHLFYALPLSLSRTRSLRSEREGGSSCLYFVWIISIAKRCSYNSPAQRSNPNPTHALKQERPMM